MPQLRKIRSTGNNRSQPHSTAPHLNDQNRVHQVVGHRFISGEKIVGCFIVLILWALYDGFLASSSTTLYEQKTSPAMRANGRKQEASVTSNPGGNTKTLSIAKLNDFLVENDASKVSSAPSIVTNPNYLIFHHYVHTTQSSAIEDMLMCHAYAFHKNATYGGACSGADTPEITANEALLDAIGLKEALPFKCSVDYPKTRVSMIPRSSYRKDDTRIWTPEYLDFIRSLLRYPKKKRDVYTIAVHIRRGNTSPCQEVHNGYYKYLPNSHYLSLIDKYNKSGARVIIFSQPESFEALDEFNKKGYDIYLENDVENIWRHFLTADVLILSRSDFSMVPAYLTKGKVIYTPMWHKRGRGWVQVQDDIMQRTDKEMKRLQNLC
jgi:hypothetical protein